MAKVLKELISAAVKVLLAALFEKIDILEKEVSDHLDRIDEEIVALSHKRNLQSQAFEYRITACETEIRKIEKSLSEE